MKKLASIITFIFICQMAKAQYHEIGVFLGGSNYIGDIGKTTFVDPNRFAYGLLYKWNRNVRYSWRFSLIQSTVQGDDNKTKNIDRKNRGLAFENTITEASAGLEFNFFRFDLNEQGFKSTPYLYTGLSFFNYDNIYFLNKTVYTNDDTNQLAIPIIAGYKMKIADKFVIGLEAGARYSFADDIDGSNPKNSNFKNFAFGNTNSKDWYVFSGITFTYTFGEKPCFCVDDN
jgi:hypothetical protein